MIYSAKADKCLKHDIQSMINAKRMTRNKSRDGKSNRAEASRESSIWWKLLMKKLCENHSRAAVLKVYAAGEAACSTTISDDAESQGG